MTSLDIVVANLLADMRDRKLVDKQGDATPELAQAVDWTSRTTRRPNVPHITRAQAAALLRLRDPRTRKHAWGRLHGSVRAALVRKGLVHRDIEPTELGELVTRLAEGVLGPMARSEGNKPPRPCGDLRRRW